MSQPWGARESEAALRAAMDVSPDWQAAVQELREAQRLYTLEQERWAAMRTSGNPTITNRARSQFLSEQSQAEGRLYRARQEVSRIREELIRQIWAARATGGTRRRKHRKSKHRKTRAKSHRKAH